MKTIRARFAVLSLIGSLAFIGYLGFGREPVMAYEVHSIRLTGMLLPLEEEVRKTDTVNVIMNGREWIFQVAKAENPAGTGVSGRTALRHVFPARLMLTGSKVIENLREPEIVGKTIIITGFLYAASRILFVTAVEKPKESRGAVIIK